MGRNMKKSDNSGSKRKDVLSKARKDGVKLLKEEEREWKKLRKQRLKHLREAREARQLKILEEEENKKKKHRSYFKSKVKTAFKLWLMRLKESIKDFISGKKIPKVEPEEEVDIKNVSETKVLANVPGKERKIQQEITFIEEEINELNKPVEKIKDDIKTKKKDIKKILSPVIYTKTKELIRLEKMERKLREKLDGIRNHDGKV
jgi:hypothetical protein